MPHQAEEVLQDGGVQLEAGLVEGVGEDREDLLQDRQEVRLVESVHELRPLRGNSNSYSTVRVSSSHSFCDYGLPYAVEQWRLLV